MDRVTTGAELTPVPLSAIVCGEPLALSATVRVPVRVPAAVGVNLTEMEQLPPEATLDPHVFVSAKSPEAVMDVMLRADPPELVSVTACAALVVPWVCDAKVRLVGETVTLLDETPVPVRATV